MKKTTAFMLLVLVGCTSTGWDQGFDETRINPATPPLEGTKKPDEKTPSGLTAPGPWVLVDLAGVLSLAGANDLEVATAVEHLEELRAGQDAAVYRFFPSLMTGMNFSRQVGEFMAADGTFIDATRRQTLVGLRGHLKLQLGEAVYAVGTADHMEAGGRQHLESTRRRSMLLASHRFYDLVASVQEIEIAREALQFAEALLAFHESRLRQGVGISVDVERARARVEAEKIAQGNAELRYRETSARLSLQLRMDPQIILYPGEGQVEPVRLIPDELDTDALVARGLDLNPDLGASIEAYLATNSELEAAKWGWLVPSLFLEGSVDQRGENSSRFGNTQYLAGGLEWEISLGHFARRRSAAARRNLAAISVAKVRERLIADIVTTHHEITLNLRNIAAAERRIQAAESTLRLAESRNRAGAGLLLEVLDARVELTEARLARLTAITEYNKNQVTLHVLAGDTPREGVETR